jgi:hypothetical protein
MLDAERVQELAQRCLSQQPTIILGSGASVPHGIPGMWPLGQHLAASTLPPTCGAPEDSDCWSAFLDRIGHKDLESALTEVQVTAPVLSHIIETTWRFLNSADIAVFHQMLRDRRCLPLTRLFEHLLRSTAQEIHVITPNYDRLAEYAAEAAGFTAYTGFGLGLFSAYVGSPPPRVRVGVRSLRTVNVWKVHGSFGWFADSQGAILSLPPMQSLPADMTPAIVTPGIEKFRRTHDEPFRSAMHSADDAVRAANGFLCVGFGFNDPHLQPLLTERCSKPGVSIVLLTKEISPTAHELFRSGRCLRYLALEECAGGVRAFSNEAPNGVELPGEQFWQLDRFLTIAT